LDLALENWYRRSRRRHMTGRQSDGPSGLQNWLVERGLDRRIFGTGSSEWILRFGVCEWVLGYVLAWRIAEIGTALGRGLLHLGYWLLALFSERDGRYKLSFRLGFAEGRMDGGRRSRILAGITGSSFIFLTLFLCPPAQLAIETLMLFQGLLFFSSLVALHKNTQLGRIEVIGKVSNLSSVLSPTRGASEFGQLAQLL